MFPLCQILIPEASDKVVVDHSGRLHKCIADGRADEREPALDEILAHGIGLRRARRHISHMLPAVLQGFPAHEAPHIGVKTVEFLLYSKERLGVPYGGADFQTVANDARIFEQGRDLRVVVAGDLAGIEPIEGTTVIVPLPQDSGPAQAGLSALENQKLEEAAVVVKGRAPFEIVVGNRQNIARSPGTAHRFDGPLLADHRRNRSKAAG